MVSSPTLTNFGIPNGPGRGGILMPKVKNRFRVKLYEFGGVASAIAFTQQVVTVARPSLTMAPVTIHSYNSTAYYAGKAEWETVAITVRDDMSNSVSALISAQVQRQMNFFDQTVPSGAHNYKFNMDVDTLDGSDGAPLETWWFEGCFLSATNWESFDYSSSDAMTIDMTIRFDNVTQNKTETSRGLRLSAT